MCCSVGLPDHRRQPLMARDGVWENGGRDTCSSPDSLFFARTYGMASLGTSGNDRIDNHQFKDGYNALNSSVNLQYFATLSLLINSINGFHHVPGFCFISFDFGSI